MSDDKRIRKAYREENLSGPARAKMSDAEKAEIRAEVQKAMERRDFPKFKAALLRLGFDEHSKEFETIEKLWNEHVRASRSPSKLPGKP
jgi:hypothetical protein